MMYENPEKSVIDSAWAKRGYYHKVAYPVSCRRNVFAPKLRGGRTGKSKWLTSFSGPLALIVWILVMGTVPPRVEAEEPTADGKRLEIVRTFKRPLDAVTFGWDWRITATATLQDGKITGRGGISGKWWDSGGACTEWSLKGTTTVDGTYSIDPDDPKAISFSFRMPVAFTATCVKGRPKPPKDDGGWFVGATWPYDFSKSDDAALFKGVLKDGRYEHQHSIEGEGKPLVIATEITLAGASAPALAERLTVGGKVEKGDIFTVQIGTQKISVTAPRPAPPNVASEIAKAWLKAGLSEKTGVLAVASGSDVWLTAKEPGKPFASKINTTEADGEETDGQIFSSSPQFFAPIAGQGLWKKEIRHCGRLLGALYAQDPSPTAGFFEWFECPVCGARTQSGEWEKVK